MNQIRLTILFIAFVSSSLAQEIKKDSLSFSAGVGYNHSKFVWSIAGNAKGENPNVLSELIWDDLKGTLVSFNATYGFKDRFGLKLRLGYANFTKGNVNDTDYADDDRQSVFYQEDFSATRGYDVQFEPSIVFSAIRKSKLEINPFVGYILQRQKLYLYDFEPQLSPNYLNSNYHTNLQGLLLGSEFNFKAKRFLAQFTGSVSLTKYNATARWNLIEQLAQPKSFTHRANAFPVYLSNRMIYKLTPEFGIVSVIETRFFKTSKGTDKAFYNNGRTMETQFNGAKSKSYGFTLGFSYQF